MIRVRKTATGSWINMRMTNKAIYLTKEYSFSLFERLTCSPQGRVWYAVRPGPEQHSRPHLPSPIQTTLTSASTNFRVVCAPRSTLKYCSFLVI